MKFKNPTLYTNLQNNFQSLLKTDVRYLVRGSFVLSLGQIFAGLSGFILTICLVRIFDKTEYGLYTYIFSLAGMAGVFTLSGMDTVVAQEVARGDEHALIRGFWSKLRWGIPVTLITLFMGGYYLFKDNEILGYSLIIIGFFSPFLYTSSLYASYFGGKKQFKKITIDNIIKNGLITLSIIVTAYVTHSVIFTILAYFFSSTVISVLRYVLIIKKIPQSRDTGDTGALSLAKHLSVMDSFSLVATHIDKIIVFQLLGATPLALYALALAPVKQMQGISKLIRTLVLPKFSSRTIVEFKKTMPHKVKVSFLASLFFVICYCILSPFFFHYFFPEYREALRYSQVLSLSLLFIPFILYVQALTSLGKTKELYILQIAKPIVKILLLIILIPQFGIWGAIFSFILSHLVSNIILFILFQRMT